MNHVKLVVHLSLHLLHLLLQPLLLYCYLRNLNDRSLMQLSRIVNASVIANLSAIAKMTWRVILKLSVTVNVK